MNIRVHVFVWTHIFISLGQIPEWNVWVIQNFLRNCRTVFQSGCTVLRSHLPCMRFPVAPHPRQHLVWSVSLILALLVVVKWCLPTHFPNGQGCWASFMCLFLCHLYILYDKVSTQILCSFLSWAVFLLLSLENSLHMQDTIPLSDVWFSKIFLPVCGLTFILLTGFCTDS